MQQRPLFNHLVTTIFSIPPCHNHFLTTIFSQPPRHNHLVTTTLSQTSSHNHLVTTIFSQPPCHNHLLTTTFSQQDSGGNFEALIRSIFTALYRRRILSEIMVLQNTETAPIQNRFETGDTICAQTILEHQD